ncbi:MAG: Hsp20/alpha crystallin family protein [Lewinella sp.]|nr:Hsp20/alpha crystallin family protein [Lewinella sp.]
MGIVKWNSDFFPTVNRVFDDLFATDMPEWTRRNAAVSGSTLPAVNVKETEDDFRLEVAVPGMRKDDFTVEVKDGILTITGQREQKDEQTKANYTRREFSYTSFRRRFTLPESADDAKISAAYTDGILEVVLPKKEEAKPQPVRLIEIG